jgi:hypothetical protein
LEQTLKKHFVIPFVFIIILLTLLACSTTQVQQIPQNTAVNPTQVVSLTKVILHTQSVEPPQIVPTAVQATQAQSTGVMPTQTPSQVPGTLDGKALVADHCTTCHGLGPVQRKHTTSDWNFILANMMDRGAQLNTDEQAAVLKYLTTTYGR